MYNKNVYLLFYIMLPHAIIYFIIFNKMGQCNSNELDVRGEIWIIDSGKWQSKNDDNDMYNEVTIKALLRTLSNTKELRRNRKVYLSCWYDIDKIQPILDHYDIIAVKTDKGVFNGLFALDAITSYPSKNNTYLKSQISNLEPTYIPPSSSYNNIQDAKYQAHQFASSTKQDLIYILLIGDIPVNPELQLPPGVDCSCGYYTTSSDVKAINLTLSGSVIKRHHLDFILKSFSKIEDKSTITYNNLKQCIFYTSVGKSGLQPIIKYENKILNIQSEIKRCELTRKDAQTS